MILRPTGSLISGTNKLMVICIQGRVTGRTQEQINHAARNRRNYLDRRRTASGKWEK